MENSKYRSEVFKLCTKLQTAGESKEIAALIYDMSVSIENPNTGYVKPNLYGDFAYIAKNSNNQFHGFLFLDDNIDTLTIPDHLQVEKLSDNARFLIEQGHMTLIRFIDLCLSDLRERSQVWCKAINPYFLYKDVNCISVATPILKDEDLAPAVNAFKNGSVYKTLVESGALAIFNKLDLLEMQELMASIEREMKKSFGPTVSGDLKNFVLNPADQYKNISDVMFAIGILGFALKESLRITCQLFYEAICGGELIVLNNNNIINIEKQNNDIIGKKFKVLVQGVGLNYTSYSIGSVLLMDCDPTNVRHIHEFGTITALTESFACDQGNTTKFSFVTVDDELINIHGLTKIILAKGIPPIKEVEK